MNFFELNENQRLVDLPGYGYAKVPLSVKRKWDINLSEYLRFRQSLRGLILLMDSRHPLTEYDRQILMWSSQTNLEVHILLTKADKQKNNALKTTLEKVKNFTLDPELSLPSISVQLFSSKSKLGLKEFEEKINSWFTRELLNPQ
jgi:GTP-binding protein